MKALIQIWSLKRKGDGIVVYGLLLRDLDLKDLKDMWYSFVVFGSQNRWWSSDAGRPVSEDYSIKPDTIIGTVHPRSIAALAAKLPGLNGHF